MKFVHVLKPIPFNDCLYMPRTYICADETVLADFVTDGSAEWCDDPNPPEPAPTEAPAP